MKTWPLYFSIENGAIQQPQFSTYLNRLLAYVKKYGNGEYQLTIKRREKKRSNPQNAYYWGVVIPIIHDCFLEVGNKCSANDVHEYLKYRFSLAKTIRIGNQSSIIQKSTTGLTTEQFETYLEQCKKFTSEVFGVVIPNPDEAKQKLMY